MTTLPVWKKQWKISFLFKLTEYAYSWSNLLHVTTNHSVGTGQHSVGTGQYSGAYGDRNPSIFFKKDTAIGLDHITVYASINGTEYFNYYQNPVLNAWTPIRLSQEMIDGRFIYSINIDDWELDKWSHWRRPVENTDAREFYDVKVYAAWNNDNVVKGFIKDLSIEMK